MLILAGEMSRLLVLYKLPLMLQQSDKTVWQVKFNISQYYSE